MVNTSLRRNAVFVAGWAVAGLAIAFVVNQYLSGREGAPPQGKSSAVPSGSSTAAAPTVPVVAVPTLVSGRGTEPSSDPVPAADRTPVVSSYAAAVRISAPAVVSVTTQTKVVGVSRQRTRSGQMVLVPREALSQGLGSGVIVDAQGHIITNEHVIQIVLDEKQKPRDVDEIFVQLADGRIAPASVVGKDPATDLALLKIDLQGLPVMPLGRADRVEVGDTVLAIGSPLGLTQTVTHGIVSAKGRAQVGVTTYENFIQTDAAINHGNSGGALVNVRGELIGINTASIKYQGSEGLGMAIPVDLVRGVMQEILQHGRVIRGWLGLVLQDIPEDYARQNKLPNYGILIKGLHPNSPAYRAGLVVDDQIETLNGQPVRSGADLMERIARTRPGSSVKITGIRGRDRQPFSVELEIIEAPEGSQ
jgi:serine protease DegS